MARGREAISARVVANALESSGVKRVIFVDIQIAPMLAELIRRIHRGESASPLIRSDLPGADSISD